MYTLDTNAILCYLEDDASAVSILRNVFAENVLVYESAVTEIELFAYSELSPEEQSLTEVLLATISVIPLDSRIARRVAPARKHYGLKLADRVIAAVAILTGSKLLTRDTREFRKIPSLTVVKI